MDTDARKMDHNHDHFRDLPKSDQINVANKWLYSADNGTQVRWGWKFVQETAWAACSIQKHRHHARGYGAELGLGGRGKNRCRSTDRISATATPTAILK